MGELEKRPQISLLTLMACGVVASMFGPALYYILRDRLSGRGYSYLGTPNGPQMMMFMLGCLGILLIIFWKVKPIWLKFTAWFVATVGLGVFGSFIPFGSDQRFYGWGFPFYFVVFQNGWDYSKPSMLVMNPVSLFVAGGIILAVLCAVTFIPLRDFRSNSKGDNKQ
jgi:hypothetical protein